MEELRRFIIFTTILSSVIICRCHNITQILESDSSYSEFSKQLSLTKVADEINSRQTITVLVLSNGNMASVARYGESAIKNVLSLLVVLDYFDEKKLKNLAKGNAVVTTLYQTSGIARGNEGFLNITDLKKNDEVVFGSAIAGSDLKSKYVKTIKALPYNISVVEISAPVILPSMVGAPSPSSSVKNLTQILNSHGCRNFSALLSSSGVIKAYESAISSGLTVFAPTDGAFNGPRGRDLRNLSSSDLALVLSYHATTVYSPLGTLKAVKGSMDTIATRGTGKYKLKPAATAGGLTLSTGVDSAKIVDTVLDAIPVSIFTIDNVLLPVELFGKNHSRTEAPAPAPAPEAADSPPAPATMTPEGAPVESPSDSPDDATSESFVREPRWAAVAAATAVVFGLQWLC